MGSASSKFKKYLQHGDEFAAMQVFQSSPELRKNLDPNLSYGDSHHHNTALHYAAKHGMKHLLRTFLNDLGGNPNKKNGCNETSLHAACQLSQQKSFSAQERRAACVALLLQWRGVPLNSGGRERVDLQAQDQKGNTALHCAATSGLKRCVELLLNHGSPLFIENHDKFTPCDMAMRNNHHDIAQLLESRMVFADSSDTINEAELYGPGEQEEVYSGLRTQDLQEAKDQLLVETSDMLHIPLFTAEALLRDNEWSREALLEKWMKDPVQCCQLAGVQPPTSALQHCGTEPTAVTLEYNNAEPPEAIQQQSLAKSHGDIICEICMLAMPCWDRPVLMSCNHRFCTSCWESYLTVKIQDGDAHHILCPAYQCHILVPVEVIEKLVSPDMARRYLQFDIKAFVESNRSIKWCPMPGCGRAVRLPETEQTQPSDVLHNIPSAKPPLLTSHAVDCGNGHFFCWECLGEAHAPCGCNQWHQWQQKISEVKPEELRASCIETEDAANCLWLVTNSKPCPNCKSPIQKNEGCNHMKCSKCKFDFCWVCLENWKKHSSATGGYFRCNRFEAVHKADEKQGILISEAMLRNQQMQELNRFLHYYTRFRNHENSQKLEEPLLNNVRQKMEILASSLSKGQKGEESAEKGTRFVEDGVRELLKARRVLCGSYVYGYYLEDNGYNKTIFEFMQNELEEVTEKLSEMVARPYLRTPRPVIIQTTTLARRKRHEFVRAVSKGLIPPETPPTLRKVRKRRFPGLMAMDPVDDEQMSHAIAASLKDLDPNNPWVKDSQGRHTNLSAIYDWPDFDSDEEETEVNRALAVSLLGECSRVGCSRPRARNPRTSAIHDYCSLRCSRTARLGTEDDVYRVNVTADYNMDLVIALEMSRLQMIEDEMKKRQRAVEDAASKAQQQGSGDSVGQPGTSVESNNTPGEVMDDHQLKLAIQLSLQETTKKIAKSTSADPSLGSVDCIGDISSPDMHAISALKVEGEEGTDLSSSIYHKTSADLTVDYFLKSLAGRQIDLKNLNTGPNMFSPDDGSEGGEVIWGCGVSKTLGDKELLVGCGFKPCIAEDGRFEIGDIHENGCFNDVDEYDETDSRLLKRSHSTGDLCTRGRRGPLHGGVVGSGDEPRYHLDSDHSSQHEEKPEDIAKRILAFPAAASSAKSMSGRHFLLLHHHSGGSNGNAGGETSLANSEDGASIYYGGQSSVEDTTTTSDSLNADLEVCGILGTTTEDDEEGKGYIEDESSGANSSSTDRNSFSEREIKPILSSDKNEPSSVVDSDVRIGLVSGKSSNSSSIPVVTSVGASSVSSAKSLTGNSLLEAHRKAFKAAGGKTGGSSGSSSLRIRICKSPNSSGAGVSGTSVSGVNSGRQLETDSSNEYESETGIPKSPTLFISGVSISRTPEPRSPAIVTTSSGVTTNSSVGRQSRSSSLTVPPPPPLAPPLSTTILGSSSMSLNTATTTVHSTYPEPQTPMMLSSSSPVNLTSACVTMTSNSMVITPPPLPPLLPSPGSPISISSPRSGAPSPILTSGNGSSGGISSSTNQTSGNSTAMNATKSKSASEPEREREMFRFPKSSTDGALSSVLHVQESNLSSDDFHEALFLLERSPKGGGGSSKRRKKSKKERHKDKENSNGSSCSSKVKEFKEASSAL
ncbi:uncharacterized protein [Periplaneta americana]|uniref:uncharacterized protein n=1 Tax=Periplaneta americana TaxID=6978 RepID=UPI0037E72312